MVILFTVGLILTASISALIILNSNWYPSDYFFGSLFQLINIHPLLLLAGCWIIGFIIILVINWKRISRYFDTIVEASNDLVSKNDELIRLPLELKQVEDQMNQVKQEAIRNERIAREAEQRKNDLIVYLAHDLKTPLTSVIGYLTLLRDEQDISKELRQKYTSISLDKAVRLEDLINEFFDITRFSLSQLTLEPSQVNVTRMLEQIAFEFQPLMEEKNLTIQLDSPIAIEMKCDVSKMERVFDNIIRNAVSYSFPDSTISIRITEEEQGVTIRFSNKGHTIPKEKLTRIFERFYRLDSSRSTNTGGAGIGLAIAKEIVELHKGTISVSSSNDNIEFTISLPTLRRNFVRN
ncbi:HAMP domain-containing histidine kinase [Bacillus sp. YZJH907-2]|uniref:histidine kinase n=2 Tax=Halalkalibacter suaedae TaxID=2822140 RepID=A0A941ANQ4_9BACI|nr:HAMP domain-containing histidine kinase [Bacillus suaedae]